MPNRSAISGASTLELTLAAVLIAGVIGLVTVYLRTVLPNLERRALISFGLENVLVTKPRLGVSVGVPIAIGALDSGSGQSPSVVSSPRKLFPHDFPDDFAVRDLFDDEVTSLGRIPSGTGNHVSGEWCLVLFDPSQQRMTPDCELSSRHVVSRTYGPRECPGQSGQAPLSEDLFACINSSASWILLSHDCMDVDVNAYELPLLVAMFPLRNTGLDPRKACAVREIAAPWMAE